MAALDDDAATRLRRTRMGFIFQAFHVLPHLTLHQNVALPLLLNRESTARADEMLAAVGLAGRGADFPRQLSGRRTAARGDRARPGPQARPAAGGRTDRQPRPDTAGGILRLLRAEIKATGAGAIMVTHSHAAAAMADEVLLLTRDGLKPA